jgi:hypothetical protein
MINPTEPNAEQRQAAMQETQELQEIATDASGYLVNPEDFPDALDLATDQDRPSWFTDQEGKRIAAIVPVEVLEFYQAVTDPRVTAVGRHRLPGPGALVELDALVDWVAKGPRS